MQNDHLEDALLFIRSALEELTHGHPKARYELGRAIEEIEAFREGNKVTPCQAP